MFNYRESVLFALTVNIKIDVKMFRKIVSLCWRQLRFLTSTNEATEEIRSIYLQLRIVPLCDMASERKVSS